MSALLRGSPPPREGPYERAVAHVSGDVRAGDRVEVQRALLRHAAALECLALGAPNAVDAQQALHDVYREPRIRLNGVEFRGDAVFCESLRRVAFAAARTRGRFCGARLYEELVQRCARTSSGADAYFGVQTLLGVDADSELVVAPKREAGDLHFIDVQCRRSEGALLCVVAIHNSFSLYRPFEREPSTGSATSSLATPTDSDFGDSDEWIALFTTTTDTLRLRPRDADDARTWARTLRVSGAPTAF